MKRWRVAADGALGTLLQAATGDDAALAEGRVFVNRKRVHDARFRVPAGALVEVGPQVQGAALVPTVLHQDADLVVVDKPAGLSSVPDHLGDTSVLAFVAQTMGVDVPALHATSRLDRMVSGVMIVARTERARQALAHAREQGTYARTYVAIAAHAPRPPQGVWQVPIGRDRDPRLRKVGGRDATQASTQYRTVACTTHASWLELAPHTGRTHQLRVHCAHAGCALDGDREYRGRLRFTAASGQVHTLGRVALHAARVAVPWPTPRMFEAPVPAALAQWWQLITGENPPVLC